MEKDKFSHIEDIVNKIIADALCLEKNKIKGNSLLEKELGADYLDVSVIQMNLEDAFGIMIPDKDLVGKDKVSEIIDYIKGRMIDVTVSREKHK